MYKHPGVYVEHVPSGVLAIEAASTSIAAFLGPVRRGVLNEPVFVTSVSLFAQAFGTLDDSRGGIRDQGDTPDYFGFAVNAFFANGGSKAYIVPVGGAGGASATTLVPHPTEAGKSFRVTAASDGAWANGLQVRLRQHDAADAALGYDLALGLTVDGKTRTLESFTTASVDPASGLYLPSRINGQSGLVRVDLALVDDAGVVPPAIPTLGGGTDPGAPGNADYAKALEKLRDYRDIGILLLPGKTWIKGGDNGAIEAAIAHAEYMASRMVIVDPPDPRVSDELTSPKAVSDLGAPTSPYSALYYPWLTVANPYYDADLAANRPKTFALPPSAFAAGIWARIDTSRGVWKAPAGLEATVRATQGPNILIGNEYQDNLNEWGVNCIRPIIGPSVLWGARTLASKAKPEFRYIPVRRTQSMIGESLYGALQAVVFEPNDHKLWASLRASTTDFMDGLFRAGAFQGEKASEAFFVRCGLGSTMTQGDIDAGIVRLVAGFAPLKPAEFVIVQIQQIVGQAA